MQGRLSPLPQVGCATAGDKAVPSCPQAVREGPAKVELSSKCESHLLKVEGTGRVSAGALVGRASGHTEGNPTLNCPLPTAALPGGPGDHTYVLGRG